METIILLAIFVIAVFYNCLSWGIVIPKLWMWFVIPLFPQLPELTIIQAIGLMLVIESFIFKSEPNFKADENKKYDRIVQIILAPWLFLLLGYIIHLFY